MYERLQIDTLLQTELVKPSGGLALMRATVSSQIAYIDVVLPAFRENELAASGVLPAFDSDSSLSRLHQWIKGAEVIVADLGESNADLLYVLGLCHGLGRCPLLLVRDQLNLPFNLRELRCVQYPEHEGDLSAMRESLTRAVRVHLSASRAMNRK